MVSKSISLHSMHKLYWGMSMRLQTEPEFRRGWWVSVEVGGGNTRPQALFCLIKSMLIIYLYGL